MNKEQFTTEMTNRGCVSNGNVYCGSYQGYPFSAGFGKGNPGGTTQFALRFLFDRKFRTAGYFKALKKEFKPLAKVNILDTGSHPSAVFQVVVSADSSFAQVFDGLVAGAVRTARERGLGVPANCPICRQPGCDAYAFHGVDYVPVHAACVQSQSTQKQMKVQQNEQQGSYALGLLGAVLGGLAGAVPTVLLIAFANIISGWLCALIPLGAYYGYKLLRGKMSRGVLGIVILVSVVMAPVTNYLSELVYGIRDYGVSVTPVDYLAYFIVYPGDMLPGLLQTLLFIGIGVLIVSGIVRRGNKHEWQEATFSLQTLRPMEGKTLPVPPEAPAPALQAAAMPVAPAAPAAYAAPTPPAAPQAPVQQAQSDIEMQQTAPEAGAPEL